MQTSKHGCAGTGTTVPKYKGRELDFPVFGSALRGLKPLLTISISCTRSEPRAADKTEDVGSARFLNQMIVDKVALRVYYVLGYSEGGVCRNEDRSTH